MTSPEQARWFSEHVHPHEPALRAYLSKRFPQLPDHDDVVQETYARLLRVERPDRLAHARAFLFITARNAAIDVFRRAKHRPTHTLEDVSEAPIPDESPGVIETLEQRQRAEILREALQTLPERCREVMSLRYLDGLSAREIASRLGISLGTVKCHLIKGIKDCARVFVAHGLVDAQEEKET